MLLFHQIMGIARLPDGDGRSMCLIALQNDCTSSSSTPGIFLFMPGVHPNLC